MKTTVILVILSFIFISGCSSNEFEQPPLNDYIIQNDITKVKEIIDNGGDVNYVSELGASALNTAIFSHNLPIAKLLIENGADVNFKGNTSTSPLVLNMYISDKNKAQDFEIAKLLIENGADVNEEFYSDEFPSTPLTFAIIQDDLELINLLIQYGADVNLEIKDLGTPLSMAQWKGNKEVIDLILGASKKNK